ncbi:MAG: septum formation protein Maf [Verrucomicrobiales bacterium]|nr:septum formation protein Maf [Verrucomicrobiales bacterium]
MALPASAPRLILASGSPRRAELLREAGIAFEVIFPEVEEIHDAVTPVGELAAWNARLKTLWVAQKHPGALVLGADTLVSVAGEALAKPSDLEEAHTMVRRLAGRTHTVLTAVCLCGPALENVEDFAVETRVTFRPLSDDDIRSYHALVNPLDKAGAYAAQEHGDRLLESVEGSITNVIGLPMEALLERLARTSAIYGK